MARSRIPVLSQLTLTMIKWSWQNHPCPTGHRDHHTQAQPGLSGASTLWPISIKISDHPAPSLLNFKKWTTLFVLKQAITFMLKTKIETDPKPYKNNPQWKIDRGLEKELSGQEHLLLCERMQAQFLAPTGGLPTVCNSSLRESGTTRAHSTCMCVQVKYSSSEIINKSEESRRKWVVYKEK